MVVTTQTLGLSHPRTGSPVPEVSICIANWNCRDRIRECLHSLCRQPQGAVYEVIVVDNGSTDGAVDVIAQEFPEVTLIRNATNQGFSRANNIAARLARGRYLLFLNNDTVVPPGALRRLINFADSQPDVGMIGPRLNGADGLPQISYRRRPTLTALLHRVSALRWTGLFRKAYRSYRREAFEPHGVREVEALLGAVLLLPRAVFERYGPWDEDYAFGCEDLDLSTRIGRQKPVVYFGSVEIIHYGREASRSNTRFTAPNLEIGYVHYLRKTGISDSKLRLYKLLVTLDTPIQFVSKSVQAGIRLLRRKPEKAVKSWRAALGFGHFFVNDLIRFWKA